MNTHASFEPDFALQSGKRIQVVLPDNGTDRELMQALRRDMGINRADTIAVRAVAALQQAKTKRGRLPEPVLAKLITVIVTDEQADAVFDFIYRTANIGQPGGGMVMMDRLLGTTAYALPEGVPDET